MWHFCVKSAHLSIIVILNITFKRLNVTNYYTVRSQEYLEMAADDQEAIATLS